MKRAILLASLLALAAVAHLAPSAAAQTAPSVAVAVDAFDGALRPLSPPVAIKGTVTYNYVGPVGATQLSTTKVSLSAVYPAWASVTVSPATVFLTLTGDETQATATAEFFLLVATTADAPAFAKDNIVVKAVASPNGQLEGASGDTSVPIFADYFSLIDARVEQPIRKVGPQTTIEFPITISNFGNALTKITFDVQNKTGGLGVPLPQPVQLESKATGGTKTTTTTFISVQTPFRNGYMNEPGMVTVRVKGTYALDSSKPADEVVLALLVNTVGFHAPGPGALPFLGALGAVALVARPLLGRRP